MKKTYLQRGFTLIELLVVIAIIGILSSVVLANLGSARLKAADVAIKSDLASIKSSAAVDYDNLGDRYNSTGSAISGAACSTLTTAGTIFENTTVQNAFAHALATNGGINDGYCNLSADGSAYAIAFPLKTQNTFWCIDSEGMARSSTLIDVPYDSLTGGTSPALTDSIDTTCN